MIANLLGNRGIINLFRGVLARNLFQYLKVDQTQNASISDIDYSSRRGLFHGKVTMARSFPMGRSEIQQRFLILLGTSMDNLFFCD
jgi:hypothetical protein